MAERIMNVQEKSVGESEESANEASYPLAAERFEYAGKNVYLEESIFILEDYIRYLETGGQKLSQN